jgi:hypothetical protein
MRVVFSDGTFCDPQTLKRLILIADEIGFMDRPSVAFKGWGTVGFESEIRRFKIDNTPVKFSVHAPPSGPVNQLYQNYIEADLKNDSFVKTFLEGLKKDPVFQGIFVQLTADYGHGTGQQMSNELLNDPTISEVNLLEPVNSKLMFDPRTPESRKESFKMLLTTASINVTNALLVSENTELIPVSNTPYLGRLIAMRLNNPDYIGETPSFSASLGLAVAKSVVPDQILKELSIEDLFSYRRATKDAYVAWSTEIDKLAAQVENTDLDHHLSEIPRILSTEIKPKLIEYQNEMKSSRDKLFGELIKKVVSFEVPTISLSQLIGLNTTTAIIAFATGLIPAVPPIVDYFTKGRDIRRRNSMTYLIGVSEQEK